MKCLETRRKDGMKWRRYRDEFGVRHETFELPASIVRAIPDLKQKIETANRSSARKQRNARIAAMLKAGDKIAVIALAENISEAQAYRIKLAIENGISTNKARKPRNEDQQ